MLVGMSVSVCVHSCFSVSLYVHVSVCVFVCVSVCLLSEYASVYGGPNMCIFVGLCVGVC